MRSSQPPTKLTAVILTVIPLTPLGPSGAHWLDDPPDLSCKNNTRQYALDGPLLSCKQVGGSSPPTSS
jgi:hypothetical protein